MIWHRTDDKISPIFFVPEERRQRSRNSDWYRSWISDESWFDSPQRKTFAILNAHLSIRVLGLYSRWQSSRRVKLMTHPYLAPSLWMSAIKPLLSHDPWRVWRKICLYCPCPNIFHWHSVLFNRINRIDVLLNIFLKLCELRKWKWSVWSEVKWN